MLRQVGLPELIAMNEDEFIQKTAQLIANLTAYAEMVDKMHSLTLDETLFNEQRNTEKYYPTTLKYLIDNHDTIQQNKPPFIYLRNVTDISRL